MVHPVYVYHRLGIHTVIVLYLVGQSVVQGKSVSVWFRESESVCGSGKVSQYVVQGK